MDVMILNGFRTFRYLSTESVFLVGRTKSKIIMKLIVIKTSNISHLYAVIALLKLKYFNFLVNETI